MPDFPKLPIITPPRSPFPDLPVITPDPPRLSLSEKYGGLFYLGVAGLVALTFMLGSFGYGIWSTRDYWYAIFVVGHPGRPDAERIQAAWIVANHPAANDRVRIEIALRKTIPDLARYVIAEAMTPEAIRADPKGYALMVGQSQGWSDWLRLLLVRPMAYGVGEGYRIPWEPLDALRDNTDPAIALWATYTRAVMSPGDPASLEALTRSAGTEGRYQPLAAILVTAARAEGEERIRKLDEATRWLRTNHASSAKLWNGWTVEDNHLVPVRRTEVQNVAPAG